MGVGPQVVRPGKGYDGGQASMSSQPASVNPNSKYSIVKKVRISQLEAESKRLVLAFESRVTKEINWAVNTLAIFSCNTN